MAMWSPGDYEPTIAMDDYSNANIICKDESHGCHNMNSIARSQICSQIGLAHKSVR